jgi:signal transduction histidine kinase
MNVPSVTGESRHEAFLKAAQYIVRLTEQQDVHEHLAGLMVTFFKAAWVAFARREPGGEIVLHHGTPPDPVFTAAPFGKETGGVIADVLESGFLASHLLTLPDPCMTAFLPLPAGRELKEVMLVAHRSTAPLPKALLNTYLAVASMAGAKIESLADEQELRRHRDHLEELVRERTADLEALNRELESFSYSVSHDLRAPLRAIDGYARMILRKQGEKFDAETLCQFNVIRDNARMMGQLIEDLLAFSRLGQHKISMSGLDMGNLIDDAWDELKVINPDRCITLKIDPPLPPGRGDRTLIRQVVTNLLSNAVKFTQIREQALIEVSGYAQGDQNVYRIRDNGAGFDMQYYDKLFAVFQRLHRAEDFEGTGVGLAIVQRIIHRHGGSVWAEGEVGKGACFYFTLPAPAG